MVVAGEQQDAAVLGAAGEVAVLEHVAAAVDPRALAVPHGIDAVVFGTREDADLLAAPHGGRRHVLVDAGLEVDVILGEEALGLPEGLVEPSKRRAAVA